jgi:hypothetical protein
LIYQFIQPQMGNLHLLSSCDPEFTLGIIPQAVLQGGEHLVSGFAGCADNENESESFLVFPI